jgi:hypothetical protein
VLTYEEDSGLEQHMVFDFHEKKDVVNELIGLLSYLKRKKSQK